MKFLPFKQLRLLLPGVVAVAAFGLAFTSYAKELTFGYITPGPDTWYKREVDGFVWGAKMLGIKVVVLNSDYDTQKEVANIDSLITQGVDGMAMHSFNLQGASLCAKRCKDANIPLVLIENCGPLKGQEVVAAVDFDWPGMGKQYADYMAEHYPGKKVAEISGMLDKIGVQLLNNNMKQRMDELGKNQLVALRDGKFNPSLAVNEAQDLVQSGTKFDILYVFNEDMAAAVIRYLKNEGLLDKYIVIAQNGSPVGLPLVKNGELAYTISTSPGWQGLVSVLALYQNIKGDSKEVNQAIVLPNIPVTQDVASDKKKVVPWECDPVWIDLTKQYYPKLGVYLPDAADAPKP